MTTEDVIQVKALGKAFGDNLALHGLDLAVPRGSVFGLLGRNGAGKTTLLRAIMGLLAIDRGVVRVFGEELPKASIETRARVAYVPQSAQLFGELSLKQHARLLTRFYPRFDLALAAHFAERIDVEWERSLAKLSQGNQRKAAVVLALASGAELILLDEPAAGLDPLARRELYDLVIERLGEGGETTVVLSSHLVGDLERLADRVAIIDEGRTLRCDDVEAYSQGFVRVQVIFPGDVPPDFCLPGASATTREGSVARGVCELQRAGDALAQLEAQPELRVARYPLGLEEVFVDLVGPARREPHPDAISPAEFNHQS